MESLLSRRFETYIKENSLLSPDDRVLVAVSGGVDSMVMLSLLVRAGYAVGVAHCNFQLRGGESFEDEVLVEKEAARHGVPFYNMRFDTAGEMERTGDSVQVAARKLRYGWFSRLCSEEGYTAVAVAHHADDSIETFFINLIRGTGLRGLTGIGVTSGRVVRPMLFATRKDVMDYALLNRIDFREDSTNRSTKYLRNKIRLGLIPRLKEISPAFPEVMSHNLRRLTEAQEFIDRCVERIRAQAESKHDGIITIDPSKIDDVFHSGFVLYELLSAYGFRGDVIEGVARAVEESATGKRFYAKEYVAYIDRGKIVVTPIDESDSCEVTVGEQTRRVFCGNSAFYFHRIDIDHIDDLKQPPSVALLDADKVAFPLTARKWQEGDRFIPFGMENFKKVSDYLVDAKVSMVEKGRQFVVLSGSDIIWLAGRRIDNRFRVTGNTENVLMITSETI